MIANRDKPGPNAKHSELTRRGLLALSALGLIAGAPGVAHAGGPQGQLIWGIHVSLAPTWFDPAETPGLITPFMILYAMHDAMVKPMPGQPLAPCLAELVFGGRGRALLRLRTAPGSKISQWRPDHCRGRQILFRTVPGRLPLVDAGAGGEYRSP